MSLSGDQQRNMFDTFLAQQGNEVCADCNEKNPTWASVNNSVLVCFQCAGIHRSFGTEISQVKSVKLDAWGGREINTLLQGVSTQFVNENLLESCVPASAPKPHPQSSRHNRERYIRAKYVERAFLPGKDKPRQPPVSSTEDLPSPSSSSSSSSSSQEQQEQQRPAQTAGAIEFVGILRVTVVSGKQLGGGGRQRPQLMSLPHVCVGLGSQVFKTKPGRKDKKNPVFQEELMFSWDGSDCLNMEIMDADSFTRDETLGCCSVDILSLELPSGVPLFLDVPLQSGEDLLETEGTATGEEEEGVGGGASGGRGSGSLQIEVLVQRLDH